MPSRREVIGALAVGALAGTATAGAIVAPVIAEALQPDVAHAATPTSEQGYVALGLPDGVAGEDYAIGICFTPNFYHTVPTVTLGYYTLDNVNIPTLGRANPFGVTVHVVPVADGPFLAELLWTAKA